MEKPLSLDFIRQVVTDYFADKPVLRVEIFGSYARGEATAESDLDVLVSCGRESRITLFTLVDYKEDLEKHLGLSVDLATVVSKFVRPHIESDLLTVYEQVA